MKTIAKILSKLVAFAIITPFSVLAYLYDGSMYYYPTYTPYYSTYYYNYGAPSTITPFTSSRVVIYPTTTTTQYYWWDGRPTYYQYNGSDNFNTPCFISGNNVVCW
jgi:hypothetical protein